MFEINYNAADQARCQASPASGLLAGISQRSFIVIAHERYNFWVLLLLWLRPGADMRRKPVPFYNRSSNYHKDTLNEPFTNEYYQNKI